MNIRLFEKTDAIAVSEMIRKTIRISNTKDYPLELMEALIESETSQHVIERASLMKNILSEWKNTNNLQ